MRDKLADYNVSRDVLPSDWKGRVLWAHSFIKEPIHFRNPFRDYNGMIFPFVNIFLQKLLLRNPLNTLLIPESHFYISSFYNDFLSHCLLFTFSLCRPGQRTVDDLEIIYEELIHIKALSHLSTTVGCLLVEHP